MTRALAVTLLLFATILGIALLRYAPPSPRSADAPTSSFSASRAREIQRAISGDGASRAVGTDANARARVHLEGELGKAGFVTEIQSAMSCTRHGVCARVFNVVATRAGREPDLPGVLLMAHYDSVPCGPGASDDGVGTAAVVEAARAMGASPPLRRTVVVVLSDGEESGLLGAEAFVRDHPLARKLHGAINIDARGTSGPSAMFETSAGNAWVVGLFAKHAERPVTSSLFYEIYRRMPNDTDFTSVKGLAHGMNFANIAGVERYHTPLDSIDNADLGTLQHHGDQALAMVRALADAGAELDAPQDRSRDAVWFDVLATFIVRWPASASLGLALAALALIAGWTIRMRAWGVGITAPIAALLGALAVSLAVGGALRRAGAIPVPWVAHPLPALASLHLACIAAGLGIGGFVARRSSPQAAWAGTWLTWGAIGVATAVIAPGASFLFVVPTLAAGLVAWLRLDLAAAIPACVAAVLWMPLAILVYDGLGFVLPVAACISSTMLATTLPQLAVAPSRAAPDGEAPVVTTSPPPWNRRIAIATASAVAIAMLVAVFVPKYSANKPQRVNVVFRQDEPRDGALPPARVHAEAAWGFMAWGAPPAPMLRALGEPSKVGREPAAPWSTAVPFAEAPRIAVEGPRAIVLESGASEDGWRARVRLESPRGARTIALVLPEARVATVFASGQTAMPRHGAIVFRAVPADGTEITIAARGDGPIAVTLLDITPGLPPADVAPFARAVLEARPREAAQTQEGDVTIVARKVEL